MEAVRRGDAVAVVSPLLGGFYYGGLLTGVADVCHRAGWPVIGLQTFEPGLPDAAYQGTTGCGSPVAWDGLSGLVVIHNAANDRMCRAISERGLPVVTIGREYPGLDAPCVLPDVRGGIRSAVEHLREHGHRRIALVGHLERGVADKRLLAYRDTLAEHGLMAEPELVFATGDNLYSGGRDAGNRMLAEGLPVTAVVALSDLNAIGVMEAFVQAGLRVPEDCAVVGFGDTFESANTVPTLATIRLERVELGRRGADLLLERIAGREVPVRRHVLPAPFVSRESCGCGASTGDPPRSPASTAHPSRRPTGGRPSVRSSPLYLNTIYFKDQLREQYEVSMDLLLGDIDKARSLSWLARTSARAGCLGLWGPDTSGEDRTITIAGAFERDGSGLAQAVGRTVPVRQFPLFEQVRIGARQDEVVHVVPVRMGISDWGLLAVTASIDDRMPMGRETINQWAALLCVALDRQAVLDSLRQREESLRHAALYDHLTGLPNRALFAERVRNAIDVAREQRRRFAVLFLDLDGFKVINDSLGYQSGDRLLVQVAQRITASLGEGDMVARLGGDEFGVLVDGIRPGKSAESVAARLSAALAEPFHLDDRDVVISASVGIAVISERYTNAQDVLRDADIAMYRAKAAGKGSHTKFKVAMRRVAMQRLQLEADLRRSIEHGDFELHYQPIVDMSTGRPISAEALLRWRHPVRGLLPPSEFLDVAEEVGLTVPIGRWALRRACDNLRQWINTGRVSESFRVNINVSNRQFWHTDLLDDIQECLAHAGLTTARLSLEITEGVIMQDADAAIRILRRLHDAGLQIDVDDFGTGYSSLSALLRLPIDKLKIDRSFVARIVTDMRSQVLVRTIVRMAHDIDLSVVAEGVETAAQRDLLLDLGCRYGQGYLFAPARPVELVTEQLTVARPLQPASIGRVR